MKFELYQTIVNEKEYCLFLDCCTFGCYVNQLKKMFFKSNLIIVDQLFYTGNSDNRFIVIKTNKGYPDVKTAKTLKLSNTEKVHIDHLIFKNYKFLCEEYLSYSDYEYISKI